MLWGTPQAKAQLLWLQVLAILSPCALCSPAREREVSFQTLWGALQPQQHCPWVQSLTMFWETKYPFGLEDREAENKPKNFTSAGSALSPSHSWLGKSKALTDIEDPVLKTPSDQESSMSPGYGKFQLSLSSLHSCHLWALLGEAISLPPVPLPTLV